MKLPAHAGFARHRAGGRVAALLLCVACARSVPPARTAPAPVVPPPPVWRERWIDAHALEDGDGTRTRPWRRLDAALAELRGTPATEQLRWHLAAGLYPGAWVLPAMSPIVELVGAGPERTVLHAETQDTVVGVLGTASLRSLAIQGGAVGLGLSGSANARLDGVAFSGQRRVAIDVAGGRLEGAGVRLVASVSEVLGLSLAKGTAAVLTDLDVSGPFRRGLQAEEARLSLHRARFDGAVTAVHQRGGSASLREIRISGGRGPALFVARGTLVLRATEVAGHEFGLQAGSGAELDVSGFVSRGAERGGVSLLECRGQLVDVTAEDVGAWGGLQLLSSATTVVRLRIARAQSSGVLVRGGSVQLSDATVVDVRRDGDGAGGDGIMVRDARATLEDVRVSDAAGAGLVATAQAEVTVRKLDCQRCAAAGMVAERRSRIAAADLRVRASGPAVAVPDEAWARVDLLDVRENRGGTIWAECDHGAVVELGRVAGELPRLPRCVGSVR